MCLCVFARTPVKASENKERECCPAEKPHKTQKHSNVKINVINALRKNRKINAKRGSKSIVYLEKGGSFAPATNKTFTEILTSKQSKIETKVLKIKIKKSL